MRRMSAEERRGFRRGGVLGLTMAEAFMLVAFALLVVMASQREGADALEARIGGLTAEELEALNAASAGGVLDDLIALSRAGVDPAEALQVMGALAEGRVLVDTALLADLRKDAGRLAAFRAAAPDASLDEIAEAMRVFRLRDDMAMDRDRMASELDRALAEIKGLDESLRGLRGDALADVVAKGARHDALAAEAAALHARLAIYGDELGILRAQSRDLEAALARLKGDRTVDETAFLIALGAAASSAGAETPQAVLDRISTAIGDARAAEARFASRLKTGEIGALLAGVDGRVDERGAVILPQESVFAPHSAEISPRFSQFLDRFCVLWTRAARESHHKIDALLIEGHASSEWGDLSPDLAFRRNLELSQERAAAVLNRCLDEIVDPEHRAWARGKLTAVGFSSSRPVLDAGGAENLPGSRRVVFSAFVDRNGLIDRIERDTTITK